jgi:cytochrome b561
MALQDDAGDVVVDLHGLATDVMLGVIALHLLGVLMSSILHRENLVASMFTGLKRLSGPKSVVSAEPDEGIRDSYHWLGLLMVAAVIIFWFVYVKRPLG